jgi:signal transduction histidine kinase
MRPKGPGPGDRPGPDDRPGRPGSGWRGHRDWHFRRVCGPGAEFHRRHRRSIMLKLLLVLAAVGIFVNMAVGGFWRMSFFRQAQAPLARNVAHYARSLAAEIGSPPDTAKARALAGRYGLRIRYEGPAGTWESGPGIPRVPEGGQGLRAAEGEPGVRMGWAQHRFLVQVPAADAPADGAAPGRADSAAGGRFTFVTEFGPLPGHAGRLGLLIGLLSLGLAAAFLAIRRLLAPLKVLADAVERIRRGELGHQIPATGRDELGALARSFNAMSTDLKELIRSREQLLLDVSHELRTPITRINLALEMGPEGMAKDSIRDDLREMEAMIAEILETARLDSANGKLNLEDVDLSALAAETVAAAEARAPGARLIGTGAGAGPIVRADRARVRKVLANLLDNAVKYSRPGARPAEVRIESGPDEVTVRIEDHGMGIPEAELPRLFEPFYRVDRSRSRETGGYGLGLSLCKRIMEAHGGSIAIASREGEGTEVSLTFPRSPRS